jgi:hypothetical protein
MTGQAPPAAAAAQQQQQQQQPPQQQQQQQSPQNDKAIALAKISREELVRRTLELEEREQMLQSRLSGYTAKEDQERAAYRDQQMTNVLPMATTLLQEHGYDPKNEQLSGMMTEFMTSPEFKPVAQPLSLALQGYAKERESRLAAEQRLQEYEETLRAYQSQLGNKRAANGSSNNMRVPTTQAAAALQHAQNADAPSALAKQTARANAATPVSTPESQARDGKNMLEDLKRRMGNLPQIKADSHVGQFVSYDPYAIRGNGVFDATAPRTVAVRNSAVDEHILLPDMVERATAMPFNPVVSHMPKHFTVSGDFSAIYQRYNPGGASKSPFSRGVVNVGTHDGPALSMDTNDASSRYTAMAGGAVKRGYNE